MNLFPALAAATLCVAHSGVSYAQDELGVQKSEGLGKSRTLLWEQDGWKVYRARNIDFYSCFAFKLSTDSTDPIPASGGGMALGMLSGGDGFAIWITDYDVHSKSGRPEYEYRLIGKWLSLGVNAIDAGNRIVNGPGRRSDLSLNEIVGWEGEVRRFATSTRSRANVSWERDRFDGYLDFTGVRAAYSQLQQCHSEQAK